MASLAASLAASLMASLIASVIRWLPLMTSDDL
jgi:hypothetical protein